MRLLLLNSAHCVLQHQCISGDTRTVLLLGRHTQLRFGPTLTINDTITAPVMMLQGSSVETLSHCFQELEVADSIVGCAFVVNYEHHLQEVSDRSKEFLLALRKHLVSKGVADVERAMLEKANKLVFISMWCGLVRAEAKFQHSRCLKSSMLCHRIVYSENLLGPEDKEEKNSDDVQYIGTTASATKRARRSVRASDSEFSHIKSQDVDLRIWSGEGSLVHEFPVNFPAFNMPADDASSSGKLKDLFNRLENDNTELHKDVLTELEHCQKLVHQYGIEHERRVGLPSTSSKRAAVSIDSILRPS
jgi:hypothetical protein